MNNVFEGKLRLHTQEMPKHAAKVFVNHTALAESGISPGRLCFVEYGEQRRPVIAAPSLDKNVGRNVALLSRVFHDLTGIRLGDVIRISDAGDCPEAETVLITETEPGGDLVSSEERQHVQYWVECQLLSSEYVFGGQPLKNLRLKDTRSFVVQSVNGNKMGVAKATKATKVTWSNEEEVHEALEGTGDIEGIPGLTSQIESLQWFFGQFSTKIDTDPAFGCIIEGGQGTGKTMLLERVASSGWGEVIRIMLSDTPQIVGDHFAYALNRRGKTVILIDNIGDLIKGHNTRSGIIMTETLRDGFASLAAQAKQRGQANVAVIMTCRNRLDAIPAPLRSLDFIFSRINLNVPGVEERKDIIRYYNPQFPQEEYHDWVEKLGEDTHAYTGSDLKDVLIFARRFSERRHGRCGGRAFTEPLGWEDIRNALSEVPPTAMRDITLRPPRVHWDDIGGYEELKSVLRHINWRPKPGQKVRHKKRKGFLLYGPPGCSKTMAAQALATESSMNFLSVKGGELLNKYVGETESSIRKLFQQARDASPCIIFFDEIDAMGLGNNRAESPTQALAAMLSELDGFEHLEDVFIVAATNRPETIDPALLRPGRFDKHVYVPLPDAAARNAMLERMVSDHESSNVDVAELVHLTNGLSGAEIANAYNEAMAEVDLSQSDVETEMQILSRAMTQATRGVTSKMLQHFREWEAKRSRAS